ncbi:MAG: TonB-dependent receptor [candidate division Zixibacteria bacterium]|nr:TonB-dependent receptor [candidate division Zixibacteria bacterium]
MSILLACPHSLFAQSTTKITGKIYDGIDGFPVSQAHILINNSAYETLTDQSGVFFFENLPQGNYTLTVTAPAYHDTTITNIRVIADITREVIIHLNPIIYGIDGIKVVSHRKNLRSSSAVVIKRRDIEQLKPRTVADALESVEGVYIQKTGTATGRSEIRIRGAAPKQILVLIDGQKINPSGSGVADLNTIPVEMIEQIEVYKGGASAKFGPDALGGAVNIITHQRVITESQEADVSYTFGKWDTDIAQASLSNPIRANNLSTRLAYSYRSSDGDFPFSYSVQPRPTLYTGNRVNNHGNSYNYFGSGLFQPSAKTNLSFSGQIYKSTNGLPGRASAQNAAASTTDRRKLLTAQLKYHGLASSELSVVVGFSRFEQYFRDLTNERASQRFESQHTNDIYNVRSSASVIPWNGQLLQAGLELSKDILDHSDLYREGMSMGRTDRNSVGASITANQRFSLSSIALLDQLSIETALRYDHADTEKDSTSWRDPGKSHSSSLWSPRVGFSLASDNKVKVVLRGSYGKSFRLPSINALFWKADVQSIGNPNLRPERSEHSEIGLEASGTIMNINFLGGITYYHSYVNDIVVWGIGQGGMWRPVNRDAALTTGHEDHLSLALFDGAFEITYQNTIVTAQNKSPGHNEYNKRLTYTPHYLTTYSATVKVDLAHIKYTIRDVDIRYSTSSNTKWYQAYQIHDLTIGSEIEISQSWSISTDYRIYNLTDQDYVLITHYPMPGREWNVGLEITYGKGGENNLD